MPTAWRAGRAEADDAGAAGFAGAEGSPSARLVKGPGVCAGRTGRDRLPLAGLEKGRAGRCCFLGGFMAGLAMGGQAQKWNGSGLLQTLESEFQDRASTGRWLRPHRVYPACGRPRERIFCQWSTAPLGHPDCDRGTPGAAGACRSNSSCRHPVHHSWCVSLAILPSLGRDGFFLFQRKLKRSAVFLAHAGGRGCCHRPIFRTGSLGAFA